MQANKAAVSTSQTTWKTQTQGHVWLLVSVEQHKASSVLPAWFTFNVCVCVQFACGSLFSLRDS